MTKKEMKVIQSGIRNVKDIIEELACENYPFAEFCDPDLRDMFYSLNGMALLLDRKIENSAG